MFKRNKVQDIGFTATLKLPKYIPKDRLLDRIVFDYNLERIGQAVDWTYTPEGRFCLVVSGKGIENDLLRGKNILIPFEYIERAGKFILLTETIDSLLPKKAPLPEGDRRERAIAALEEAFEEEEESDEEEEIEEEEKPSQAKGSKSKGKKKKKKELKAFNELKEELFANILQPPESP